MWCLHPPWNAGNHFRVGGFAHDMPQLVLDEETREARMNTLAHLLISVALCARRDQPGLGR